MKDYENELYKKGITLVAGIDEVGRGPLVGSVICAAVILPADFYDERINDSKKLTAKKREMLYDVIFENAISIGIGESNEKVIDEINILEATKRAMLEAVNNLSVRPEHLLIDAVKLDTSIPSTSIIKGDAKSQSIAAASIIAKVTRDRIIRQWHEVYPEYNFIQHKGYGTAAHIAAIKEYGLCPLHRLSFVKNIIK